MKRQPKGISKGGQFAPDTSGAKNIPSPADVPPVEETSPLVTVNYGTVSEKAQELMDSARPKFHVPDNAEEAKGRTLFMREQNGYNDSDFSGLFYDPALEKFGWATTGSTAYSGGFIPRPDAADDIVDKYEVAYNEAYDRYYAEVNDYLAKVPDVGKEVKVVGGRKHKNKVGKVVWFGDDAYSSSRWMVSHRIGVLTEDGERFFVSAEQVEVKVNGEYVEAEGTSTSTGLGGSFGGSHDKFLGYLFASSWPNPNQVRGACKGN